MQIRIAGLVPESVVDGPGYRFTVFAQGCPHACPGCHNPETHDFCGGRLIDVEEITGQFGRNPLVRGVTLSGGEPMMQPQAMRAIAAVAKAKGMSVWCYTGFTLEALLEEGREDRLQLLELVDVLVDGPYMAAKRSLDLLYCGSANQRLIDMNATRAAGKVCLFVPDVW